MHNFDISDSHARNFIQRIHNYMHTTALTAARSANLISRRLLAFTILHHIINSFRRNIIGSQSHDAIIFSRRVISYATRPESSMTFLQAQTTIAKIIRCKALMAYCMFNEL